MKGKDSKCWLWQGYVTNSGYGMVGVRFKGKQYLAHRLAFLLTRGYLPEKPYQVLHRCDNKLCFRPDHLWEGTQSQNLEDSYRKGRKIPPPSKGERNGNAKLNKRQILTIRRLRNVDALILSRRFGVTRQQIYNIRRNISWSM